MHPEVFSMLMKKWGGTYGQPFCHGWERKGEEVVLLEPRSRPAGLNAQLVGD